MGSFDLCVYSRQHILSHTGEKRKCTVQVGYRIDPQPACIAHACNTCPSRFSTISNLRRHQKSCQAIRARHEAKMNAASARAATDTILRPSRIATRRSLHSLQTSFLPSTPSAPSGAVASASTPTHGPASSPIQSSVPHYPLPIINSSSTVLSHPHPHSYSTPTSPSSPTSLPTSPSSSVSNEQAPWLTPVQTLNASQERVFVQGPIPAFLPTPPSSFYPSTGYDYEYYSAWPSSDQQQHVDDTVGNSQASRMYSNLGPGEDQFAYSNLNQASRTAGPFVVGPEWGGSEPATITKVTPLPYNGYSNPQ